MEVLILHETVTKRSDIFYKVIKTVDKIHGIRRFQLYDVINITQDTLYCIRCVLKLHAFMIMVICRPCQFICGKLSIVRTVNKPVIFQVTVQFPEIIPECFLYGASQRQQHILQIPAHAVSACTLYAAGKIEGSDITPILFHCRIPYI